MQISCSKSATVLFKFLKFDVNWYFFYVLCTKQYYHSKVDDLDITECLHFPLNGL